MIHAIEAIATAAFLAPQEKLPYLNIAIRKLDTVKILLLLLWETASLEEKQYILLSLELQATGEQLGGWRGKLLKNSPAQKVGEKQREL